MNATAPGQPSRTNSPWWTKLRPATSERRERGPGSRKRITFALSGPEVSMGRGDLSTPLTYPHGVRKTAFSQPTTLELRIFVCALSTFKSFDASHLSNGKGPFLCLSCTSYVARTRQTRATKLHAECCSHQTWRRPRNETQDGRLCRSFQGALFRRGQQDALTTAKSTKPCGLQAG